MSKVIVFDIGSSFGYFRKNFTTTTALTHAIIPRSSVEGLIGSVIGLPTDQYPEKLQFSNIAVQIISPVRKLNMKYMHTNPDWWQNVLLPYLSNKSSPKKMTQFAVPASVEFLVEPRYRIYFDSLQEKINEELSIRLKNKQSHYTPYLGTSSLICFIKYIGQFNYQKASSVSKDYVPVHSVVPFSQKIPNIKLERDSRFAIEEGLPVHLDNNRTLQGTYKVVYSPDATLLDVIDKDMIQIKNLIEGEESKEQGEKKKGRTINVKFLPTKITPL